MVITWWIVAFSRNAKGWKSVIFPVPLSKVLYPYYLFARLSTCSQLTAWSRRSAWSKEDIMIICLLNNEPRLSAGCETNAEVCQSLKL